MRKISVIIIAILALMASCASQLNTPEAVSGSVILHADAENSRTYLSGTGVLWSEGDELSVFCGASNSRFTLLEGAGTPSAKFNGALPGAAPYIALYPYCPSASFNGSTLRFPVPQTQKYSFASFGPGTSPMVASFSDPASPVQFKNLFGVLRLNLTGAATITRVTLRDLGGALLWGEASLAVDSGTFPSELSLSLSGGSDTVVLDLGSGLTLAGATEATALNITLPAGTLSDGFEVGLYNGESLLDSFSTTKSDGLIKRSTINTMTSRMVTWDLSLMESANCYMVYSSARYKFKAVRGNSSELISGIASVCTLWESYGTATAPQTGALIDGVTFNDGYISFDSKGVAGNALIAAKDEGGNILWSWHIWIPSTRVTDIRFSSMSSGAIQDRNLGALTADRSNSTHNGLIYQWGRKDPFMGFCAHSTSQTVSLASAHFTSKTAVPGEATSATVGTVGYATAHPTTFITNTSGNKDWCTPENSDHWGPVKTIYDPCPPGYQVANTSGIFTPSLCTSAVKDEGGQGYNIEGIWFPFSGVYWQDGSRHASTNQCSIWSNSAGNSGARFLIDDTSSNKAKVSSISKAYGCSVRCVTAADPTPAGKDEHDFFAALPSGVEVISVSDGTLAFSDGSVFSFDSSVCGLVRVSEDGYWEINGTKTAFKHAAENFMEIGSNNRWTLNGADTGERAIARNVSAGPDDIYVANIVESARRFTVNFSDGSSLGYPKKIAWGMKVEKSASQMYVYMGHENSDNWIRYKFYYRNKNDVSPSAYPNHLDNWGLGQPARCTRKGVGFSVPTKPELFLNGESEAAVQVPDVNGANKYTGGTLHGWENILDSGSGREIFIRIEGVAVGETETVSLKDASLVEIEQHTRIARAYGDPVKDQYATIVKKWTFRDGKVSIYNEYTFTEDIYLHQTKFGMLCVLRRDNYDPSVYMSRLVRKDNDPHNMYLVEDGWNVKTDPGYNARSYSALVSNDIRTTRVEEYGDAGFSFAIQLDESSPRTSGGYSVGTNGNNYNKIYFDIANKQNVTAGTKIHSTVHWEIDYISDYKLF